ncbi:MAG: hypothetical protein AAF675_05410 [Pseudomonadota bacterium]
MNIGSTEVHRTRPISDLGTGSAGAVNWKIYGLLAQGMEVTSETLSTASAYTSADGGKPYGIILPRSVEHLSGGTPSA